MLRQDVEWPCAAGDLVLEFNDMVKIFANTVPISKDLPTNHAVSAICPHKHVALWVLISKGVRGLDLRVLNENSEVLRILLEDRFQFLRAQKQASRPPTVMIFTC